MLAALNRLDGDALVRLGRELVDEVENERLSGPSTPIRASMI
jgi:hypothetical protein